MMSLLTTRPRLKRLVAVLVVAIVLAGPVTTRSRLAPPCPSRVMAFYYGWYSGPPDYRHWAAATDDPRYRHDPKKNVDRGKQYPHGVRRDIASLDYPVLGPYSSHLTPVIDQHLQWAGDSGIDVLISSWWGPKSYENKSLDLLLDRIEKTDSPVRASVYLETWALFHGHQFQADFFTNPDNFEPGSRARIREKAVEWISYLIETFGDRRGFARAHKNGVDVPVVFVYSAALFDPVEWQDIFDRVKTATGTDAFYQGDVEGADFQALARVFDGLHFYNPAHLTAEGDLSLLARAHDPDASVRNPVAPLTDPITVGAGYRAHAAEARALGRSWAATVIPGFDDRKVRNPGFVVSRDHGDGRTYDFFWRQSLSSDPDWVLITSFNEWHEGSEVEPSVEYGDEFLKRTRSWVDKIHACPGS